MWSNPELPALSPSDNLLAELDTSSEVSPAELFSTETAREPNCGDEQSKPRITSPILDVVSPTSRAVLPISDPQQPSSIDQTICVDEYTCVRRSTASAVNCANVILQPKEDRAEAVVSAKTVDEGAKDIQHRRKRAKADPVLLWKPQSLLLYETPELLTLSAFKRSSKNLENSGCVSAESHVEEMYALVCVVNAEWFQRMTSTPSLVSRCASLRPRALFERGVIALERCYRGTLPDTFEDIYALIHVACAVSYTLHQNGDWSEDFFVDMLQWQHAITEEDDRYVFIEAMECLACCDGLPKRFSEEHNLADRSTNVLFPRLRDFGSHRLSLSVNFTKPILMLSRWLTHRQASSFDKQELINVLKNGRIMKDCSSYLDGTLAWTHSLS